VPSELEAVVSAFKSPRSISAQLCTMNFIHDNDM